MSFKLVAGIFVSTLASSVVSAQNATAQAADPGWADPDTDAIAIAPCARAIRDTALPRACISASSIPTLGRLFPISPALFVDSATGFVGIGTTTPSLRLDVNGSVGFRGNLFVDGDVALADDLDSLTFPATSGANAPMIHMFASGTTNMERTVIAHSPAFPDLGLKYDDLTDDEFVFQVTDAIPVVTIGMQTKDVTIHDGSLSIGHAGNEVSLNVTATSANLNPGQIVNLERLSNHVLANDVLQLRVPTTSSPTAQFLECEIPGNVRMRVDVNGSVYTDGIFTGPADFAEMIRVSTGATSIEPGDLLVIDPAQARAVVRSVSARSRLVAGVYSGRPGFVGSEREWDEPPAPGSAAAQGGERIPLNHEDMARLYDEVPVAMVGIVKAKVSAENGPITPGDLLVSSYTPGHAMRDDDPRPGTIVGKALETLATGTGVIRILVTLH